MKNKIKVIYLNNYSEESCGIYEVEVDHLNIFDGANIPDLQVLRSAAGYYIGTLCRCDWGDGWEPNYRDSQRYWSDRKEAEEALKSGKYEVKF